MNELALFAGAGGGILAGKLLGWRTICAVERDAYAAQIRVQRQNDGSIEAFPIWSDVCSFDGKPWRGIIDIVSGGFPCQDISAAGKGAGIDGKKSGLWKQMARIIGEVRPQYAFVENSPILTSRGLHTVLADLAALGYDAQWLCLSAAECGAPHIRDRIWILANNNSITLRNQAAKNIQPKKPKRTFARLHGRYKYLANTQSSGCQRRNAQRQRSNTIAPFSQKISDRDSKRELQQEGNNQKQRRRIGNLCNQDTNANQQHDDNTGPGTSPISQLQTTALQNVCHANNTRLEKWQSLTENHGNKQPPTIRTDWWAVEPELGRVAHGVANRVDRIRALGNGQVPIVAANAFLQLLELSKK